MCLIYDTKQNAIWAEVFLEDGVEVPQLRGFYKEADARKLIEAEKLDPKRYTIVKSEPVGAGVFYEFERE